MSKTSAKVLLPQRAAWQKAAFLTADTNWYTASVSMDGYTIVVEGTNAAFEHPEIQAAFKTAPATRTAPRIGRNELIVEAAFVEDGTSYSVEVECVLPDRNPLCTKDDFIREVVADLRVVPQVNK